MQASALALTLADGKTWVDIIAGLVTAVALIVGGIWAYYNFVKGRTYRPHLEVGLNGQWRIVNGQWHLQARVTVRNIGKSVVVLVQKGTGLRVSVPANEAPDEGVARVLKWESLRVFSVLADHEWIEPGETVSDDLLLDLRCGEPKLSLFESRFVWNWHGGKENIELTARKVLPIEAQIDGTERNGSEDVNAKDIVESGAAKRIVRGRRMEDDNAGETEARGPEEVR